MRRFGRLFIAMAVAFCWIPSVGVECAYAQEEVLKADRAMTAEIVDRLPPHLLRLIEEGKVIFSIHDEKLRAANRMALTIFQFEVKYQLQVRTQLIDNNRTVRISLALIEPKFEMKHTIVLPTNFPIDTKGGMKILKHEFDHVSITTDPRLSRLLPKSLWFSETWSETFPVGQTPTQEAIGQKCNERISQRQVAFERFLRGQYDSLDGVSRNGMIEIADRKVFFESLYQMERFEKQEYPFIDKIKASLKSKKFQETGDHYSRLDIP